MPAPFHNNVIVITGASRGIGREIALQLAGQRAQLVLAARGTDQLETVAGHCRDRGADVLAEPTDVSDPDQCRRLIAKAVGHFSRLDTLVNNAGVTMAFRFEQLEDLTLAEHIVRVNYLGSVYCTHYALPHLKQTRGRIVGVASLTGKTGVPMRSLYAASKHAMAGFFDSLRIELVESGITVTMIYPDFVESAEDCARRVVRAAAERKREVIMGFRGKMGLLLKAVAPGVVDGIARRAIQQVQFTASEHAGKAVP
jgi:NAD(P)-dependent dehydrogenase (short-subunit alcohol dehydrogenase family)